MSTQPDYFPRNYASSSAAYRAIRQYEEKHGEQGLVMTKLDKGVFNVSKDGNVPKMTLSEFTEKHSTITFKGVTFRLFPDGTLGKGYYELKTGNRRRPNSIFMSVEDTFEKHLIGEDK